MNDPGVVVNSATPVNARSLWFNVGALNHLHTTWLLGQGVVFSRAVILYCDLLRLSLDRVFCFVPKFKTIDLPAASFPGAKAASGKLSQAKFHFSSSPFWKLPTGKNCHKQIFILSSSPFESFPEGKAAISKISFSLLPFLKASQGQKLP